MGQAPIFGNEILRGPITSQRISQQLLHRQGPFQVRRGGISQSQVAFEIDTPDIHPLHAYKNPDGIVLYDSGAMYFRETPIPSTVVGVHREAYSFTADINQNISFETLRTVSTLQGSFLWCIQFVVLTGNSAATNIDAARFVGGLNVTTTFRN